MIRVDSQDPGGVVRITLSRPERHNALVPELLDPLLLTLQQLHQVPPKVLILAAEGRSFSTGGDVAAFYAVPALERSQYAEGLVGSLHASILALLSLPCPTLAEVNGTVTGGSAGLVLACDLVVASPRASFAPWYTVVGFSPDGGWSCLMADRIGRSRALEVQLLNRCIKAEEALQLGLIHQVVPQETLADCARQLAARISAGVSGSVCHTLALTRPDLNHVARALEKEKTHFLQQIVTSEAEEGMRRFLESR